MAAYISDSKNILQKNMKKNFITKKYQGVKFSREAVRAWICNRITPRYMDTEEIPPTCNTLLCVI